MRGVIKDGVYTKYEKEGGKLRMAGGAWTLNLDEVSKHDLITREIHTLVYITKKKRYQIDSRVVLERGFQAPVQFGGENKWVIPIKEGTWEITEIGETNA